jgi:predicted SAM-dependent methyltransferase
MVKLNLGCGGRPLPGYVNVDSDSLETLHNRYPETKFPEGVEVFQYDLFALPFADGTIDEIRADSLIEHLSFIEEPLFFQEMRRVLKSGGILDISTTDFEQIVKLWIAAEDNWKEFYRSDKEAILEQHWFGQGSYRTDQRWGYLAAMIFGSQNGDGQFHKNCYTEQKLRKMLDFLGFSISAVERYLWKGDRDPMLRFVGVKR